MATQRRHARACRRVRILGPGSFGILRTGIGLNATYGSVAGVAGALALISQSGAGCEGR